METKGDTFSDNRAKAFCVGIVVLFANQAVPRRNLVEPNAVGLLNFDALVFTFGSQNPVSLFTLQTRVKALVNQAVVDEDLETLPAQL